MAGRLTIKRLYNWDKFYEKLFQNSSSLRENFIRSFDRSNIDIKINSLPTMISYKFNFFDFDERESSALFIDRLVNKGYLTSSTIYPTICHSDRENKLFCKNVLNSLKELNLEIKDSSINVRNHLIL